MKYNDTSSFEIRPSVPKPKSVFLCNIRNVKLPRNTQLLLISNSKLKMKLRNTWSMRGGGVLGKISDGGVQVRPNDIDPFADF